MSPDSQIFGSDRLEEALAAHARGTADDLVQSVLSAVRAFRRSAPWPDDITMIAMRVRPSATPQLPQLEPAVQFSLPANLQVLESISQQVTQVCRSLPDLPPPPASDDFVYLVELAVSEICTNIIQHAYLMTSGEIRGSLTPLVNGIQIDLYDDGESFDPNAIPAPSDQADALNEGGYGLHIVRQIMDSVQYQADTPKGNHWRLIKYIPSE
jgi:anti-sigma regulatory factor (Ser/Thr protein kinase)